MISLRKSYILFLTSLAGMFLLLGSAVHAAEVTDILSEVVQEGALYEVKPDGTGDFVAIQEGVDSVASGDTLLIYPGVYEENVIIENKTVNLIGVDPEYCILTANSDNYHHIPLTITAGRVYGLTICGTSAGDAGKKVYGIGDMSYDSGDPESVYAWQNRYPGYVIHVDHAYAAGKTLIIENCRIMSENNYCIGIGCWEGQTIEIRGCELLSKGVSGCLFVHNNALGTGKSQVEVKNTEFKNYVSPYVMVVHSEGESNPIDLTFQNVKVYTVAYESNDCYNSSNTNTWLPLDLISHVSVQTTLAEEGYMGIQESSRLVHRYTQDEHIQFNKELEAQDSLLKDWPKLEEGITYWESGSDKQQVPGKVRHSIDMKNADEGMFGDGWCGLSSIYLTEDSSGNTLPEMNYPRPMAGSVTESE